MGARPQIFIDIEGCVGLGDKVQFSSLPEVFYKWYGIKLIDIKKHWVFDHNPYVERDIKMKKSDEKPLRLHFKGEALPCLYCREQDWVNPDIRGHRTITLDQGKHNLLIIKLYPSYRENWIASSRNVWLFQWLGINHHQKPEIDIPRGPRLYKHEDPNKVIPNQIAIHVGPSNSTTQYIPHYVLNEIKKRYCNYKIIQIGSKKDNESPFIDKRGQPIWETVKTIAESAIFIGINSGPMNIANCYPHINKKIILNWGISGWDKRECLRFEPLGGILNHNFSWIDFGWQYYTTEDHDAGRTYSYKRI